MSTSTQRVSRARPDNSAKAKRRPIAASRGLGSQPKDFDTFWGMDPLSQRRTIREGMQAIIVDRVSKELLEMPLAALLNGLNLPSSTILRKISKQERLSAAESDRIARVLTIFQLAGDVFEDDAQAAKWMQRANNELDGLRPFEVLDSQPGYDRVRDLLARIAFGVGV